MSLERLRTQTRYWDQNVLKSERTYVRENSCLMLKQIKSITSNDVDSYESKQRSTSEFGSLRRSVHREAEPKCVTRTCQSNHFQYGSIHM
jgi:hypothetical protein